MSEALWGVVVGGAIGVLAALMGGIATYRAAVKSQSEADKRERRAMAVGVLGEARAVVEDFTPDQWVMYRSHDLDGLRELLTTWVAIRARLLGLQALYPDRAAQVEDTFTTINSLGVEVALAMEAVRDSRDVKEMRDKAVASQSKARTLLQELMKHVGGH
jgi:hypothetical protein